MMYSVKPDSVDTITVTEASENVLACGFRLVLAIAAAIAAVIEPHDLGSASTVAQITFICYVAVSASLLALAYNNHRFTTSRLIHWIDLFWFALIIFFTGGARSFFFLFYFFAIVTYSFRWGFYDGLLITLASVVTYSLAAMAAQGTNELSLLLLRATFLMILGYLIAFWAGLVVKRKHQVTLLSNLAKVFNPRFGVDSTLAAAIEKTRAYFDADGCVLIEPDDDTGAWSIRSTTRSKGISASGSHALTQALAEPFGNIPNGVVLLYGAYRWLPIYCNASYGCLECDKHRASWKKSTNGCAAIATVLDAQAFISASLAHGRLFVISNRRRFSKSDALFLEDISTQLFPLIENIQLLDRLATNASARERKRIAGDLHDSIIQPYIGLHFGLTALQKQATDSNPLRTELDKLTQMAARVISDLRTYAGILKSPGQHDEPFYVAAIRRQALQLQEFYGIAITITLAGLSRMNDRMAAEVFQIVNEGLNNIRKHTAAKSGFVHLMHTEHFLTIQINNEAAHCGPAMHVAEFLPISIHERALALGGNVRVDGSVPGQTSVFVEIPV